MSDHVNGLADKATEAFFAELFKHVPAGTTGDFPPDATMAFEKAAREAVATILANAPTRKYVVAYEVEWQPTGTEAEDDDGPMDFTHSLECTDERFVNYGIVAIGDAAHVERELFSLRAQQALERAEAQDADPVARLRSAQDHA